MAKSEYHVYNTEFDALLQHIDRCVLEGSVSASFEDGSDWRIGDIRCAVRVYERYSAFGGNRVSLNVTLVGNDREIFISAITSGGSQAILFKINTVGEETVLDQFDRSMAPFVQAE